MASSFEAHTQPATIPASTATPISTTAPWTAGDVVPAGDVVNSGESVLTALQRHVAQQQALLAQQQLELTEAGRSEQRELAAERQRLGQRAAEVAADKEALAAREQALAAREQALTAREQVLAAHEKALAAREEEHERKIALDKEAIVTCEQDHDRKAIADKEMMAAREQALTAREKALAARFAAEKEALSARKEALAEAEAELQSLTQRCGQEYMTLQALRVELQERLLAARLEAQAYIGGTVPEVATTAAIYNRPTKQRQQQGAIGPTPATRNVLTGAAGAVNGPASRSWAGRDATAPPCVSADAAAAQASLTVRAGVVATTSMAAPFGSNYTGHENALAGRPFGRAAGRDRGAPFLGSASEMHLAKRSMNEDACWQQDTSGVATDKDSSGGRPWRSGRLAKHERADSGRPIGVSGAFVSEGQQAGAPQNASNDILAVNPNSMATAQQQRPQGGAEDIDTTATAAADERTAVSDICRGEEWSASSDEAFDDIDEAEPERCPREEEEEAAQAEAKRRLESREKPWWGRGQNHQQKTKLPKSHYHSVPKQLSEAGTIAQQQPSLPRQSPPPAQQLESQHQNAAKDKDTQAEEKRRHKLERRKEQEADVDTKKKRKTSEETAKQPQKEQEEEEEEENPQRKPKRSKGRNSKRDRNEPLSRDRSQGVGSECPSALPEQTDSAAAMATVSAAYDDGSGARVRDATPTGFVAPEDLPVEKGGHKGGGNGAAACAAQKGTLGAGIESRFGLDVPVHASATPAGGMAADGDGCETAQTASKVPVQGSGQVHRVPSVASLRSEPDATAVETPERTPRLSHQPVEVAAAQRTDSSDVEIVDLITPQLPRSGLMHQPSDHDRPLPSPRPQQSFEQGCQSGHQQDVAQSGPTDGGWLQPQKSSQPAVQPDFPRSQGWSGGRVHEESNMAAAAHKPQAELGGQAAPQPGAGAVDMYGSEVEQRVPDAHEGMPQPQPSSTGSGPGADLRSRKPPFRRELKGLRDPHDSWWRSAGLDAATVADASRPVSSILSESRGCAKLPPLPPSLLQQPQHPSAQTHRAHLVHPRNPPTRPLHRTGNLDTAASNSAVPAQVPEYGHVPPGPSHPHLQQPSGAHHVGSQPGASGKPPLAGRGAPGPFRRQRMKAAGRRGAEDFCGDEDPDGGLDEDLARTVDMLRQEQEQELQGERSAVRTGPPLGGKLR